MSTDDKERRRRKSRSPRIRHSTTFLIFPMSVKIAGFIRRYTNFTTHETVSKPRKKNSAGCRSPSWSSRRSNPYGRAWWEREYHPDVVDDSTIVQFFSVFGFYMLEKVEGGLVTVPVGVNVYHEDEGTGRLPCVAKRSLLPVLRENDPVWLDNMWKVWSLREIAFPPRPGSGGEKNTASSTWPVLYVSARADKVNQGFGRRRSDARFPGFRGETYSGNAVPAGCFRGHELQ